MSAGAPGRFRESLWPALIAAAVLVATLIGLSIFNARTAPLFVQRAHPVLQHVAARLAPGQRIEVPSMVPDNDPPVFTLAAGCARVFGRDYAGIMVSQTLLFALWVLACGVLGWAWAGRNAGLFCATAASVTPLGHFAALGFDDHPFNLLLTMTAAALVISPSARRRVWPVAAAGLLAGWTLRWAFVPSNGLLAAAAAGTLLAGACVDDGVAASATGRRGRWLLACAGLAGTFAVAAVMGAMRDGAWSYLAAGYYSEEVGNAPFHSRLGWLAAFSTYPYLLALYHWGVPVTLAVLAALVSIHRDKVPGRFAVTAWLAVSLAALTLIPKKHQWYMLYAAQAAAPLVGWYWASLWNRRKALTLAWIAAALAWALVGMGRHSPRWTQAAFLDVTVSESGVPSLAPLEVASRIGPEAEALSAKARELRSDGPRAVVVLDWVGPMEELRYFFALRDPKLRLYVIDAAELPPPAESPLLLYVRRPDEDEPPFLTALIDRSIRHVEDRVAEGAEPLGRLDYLLGLEPLAENAVVVHRGDAFVLFDPNP